MKKYLLLALTFAACLWQPILAAPMFDGGMTLPADYKVQIRHFIAKRKTKSEVGMLGGSVIYYVPTVATMKRKGGGIEEGARFKAVMVLWTSPSSPDVVSQAFVQEVVAFLDGRLVESVSPKEVEWSDGEPKREK